MQPWRCTNCATSTPWRCSSHAARWRAKRAAARIFAWTSLSRARISRNIRAFPEAMKSLSVKPVAYATPLLLLAALPIAAAGPWSVLWTAPSILVAAMLIAWAAESAQFFIAQGFALAILAWLQTLPEFAVEAVLAKNQQVSLLLANLTGALRLLTGLGWPMIYFTAAIAYRAKHKSGMRQITLPGQQSIQVVGLGGCLIYVAVIAWKASLTVVDCVVLTAIYGVYLW